MNEREHEQLRGGLGLIALGLEKPDASVLAHLLDCPPCERELAGLSDTAQCLTELDSRSRDHLVSETAPEPPRPELLARTLEAAGEEQRLLRRSVRRWRGAAALSAGAAASVVALGVLGGGLAQQQRPTTLSSQAVSASPWSATGIGVVVAHKDGSRVSVQLRGLPVEEELVLYAVTDEGAQIKQAAWPGKPDGTASMRLESPLSPEELDHLELRAAGKLVLTLSPEN